MPVQLLSFSNRRLMPAQFPQDAREDSGVFGPNLTIAMGTVLAAKTSDGKLYPYKAKLAVPEAPTLVKQSTGGSLSAATYSYVVTAINGEGETSGSDNTTVTTTGTTSAVVVAWAAVAGATGYKIYRGTAGSETLIATVGAVTSWADDGSLSPASATGTNEVQTVAVDTILSGGSISLTAIDSSGAEQTVKVAYNTSWTQTVADIQTALIAKLGTSAVACAVTNTHDMTITFSGTGYAALPQTLVEVDISAATGPTKATVTRTTAGAPAGTVTPPETNTAAVSDGTENASCIAEYDFVTDANGVAYLTNVTSAAPGYLSPPNVTLPVYVRGTFDPNDLVGLDADAVADMGARYLGNGFLHIP